MGAQNDFALTVDQSAGLLLDATCAARAAAARPLPRPHHHLVTRAIRAMERAQQDLFTARNDPWTQPETEPKPRQLALL